MSELVALPRLFEYLRDRVPEKQYERLAGYLHEEANQELRSEFSSQFLSWTSSEHLLKSITSAIPDGILPGKFKGTLTDVRIQSKGPDDKIYDRNALYRKRVARGNCVMELAKAGESQKTFDCVIYALKKFTGGLGDDDDRDLEDGFKFQKYFTKPISEARTVVCTRKMNGEAAHFAIRWLESDFYVIAGSKNVHLLFRTVDQIEKYSDTRYLVARDVARTCFQFFENMEQSARNILFSFFHYTKLTAVLEILQPKYQHIEDLSYLPAAKLYFISWSKTNMDEGYEEEICMSPDLGQDIAKAFGLEVTGYQVIPHQHEVLTAKLMEIRRGHGYEGEVLYFVDSENSVIGLLKKKTVWYIVVRAIREKARRIQKPNSSEVKLSETLQKTQGRIKDIQKWLALDEDATNEWIELAANFLRWLVKGLKDGSLKIADLYSIFPVFWTRFLKETQLKDEIGLDKLTLLDDPDNLVTNECGD